MNRVTRKAAAAIDAPMLHFSLNGREVSARANETLIEVADCEGVAILRLCHQPGLAAVANCRVCMLEIAGERVLAPACCRAPSAGMAVATDSERAR